MGNGQSEVDEHTSGARNTQFDTDSEEHSWEVKGEEVVNLTNTNKSLATQPTKASCTCQRWMVLGLACSLVLLIALATSYLAISHGMNGDVVPAPADCRGDVRIAHISDTHNLHDQLTQDLIDLKADILIHTGDFSDVGDEAEYANFNAWLGKIKPNFSGGVYLVLGNHDWKFLNGLTSTEDQITTLVSDDSRRKYMQARLSNAIVLDNEARTLCVGDPAKNMKLKIFGSPWNPFQYTPTNPDRVNADKAPSSDHDRVFQKWSALQTKERKSKWSPGEAWRYDEIPADVDILMTHIPPFGVFDKMPVLQNWGSSLPLKTAVGTTKPRVHLFGHVHAQRGWWEKKNATTIVGGVQYATTTNEEVKDELMGGDSKIQLLACSAMVSDRTVNPFAKKAIVGKPRLICGTWVDGEWKWTAAGGSTREKKKRSWFAGDS